MDFQYDFHFGNHDNGNLYTAANNRDPGRTQRYTYDALNRLLTAATQGTLDSSGHIACSIMVPGSGTQTKYWGESFTYDPWANLTGKGTTLCSAETTPLGATARNQLGADTYDTAGNVINSGGTAFSYNGESELVSTSNGYSYTYDGDGNRVEKSNGSSGTLYWYGGPGILLETDLTGSPQSEYLFFGGQRVARRDVSGIGSPVYYYFGNQIHSTALITDASGNIQDDADYYPWGGTVQFSSGVSNHYWFTGKERDPETGLDYFGARYYGNSMGRFLTPDWSAKAEGVPYADFHDPQSLNLYGYVRDNPITRIDKDGHVGGVDDAAEGIEIAAIGGGLLLYYYVALPQNQRNLQRAWDLTTDTLANALNNVLHRNNSSTPPPATGGQTGGQSKPVKGTQTNQGTQTGQNTQTGQATQTNHGTPPAPTVDPNTGVEVGRFVADANGNVMIEPQGGRTVPAGTTGQDTHTLYPNGSNYQRLNPTGHANNAIPHGHGHLQGTGTGKKGQGASIDNQGNVVKPNTAAAHWPINKPGNAP
jgi:RHS repeat-associated protein